MIKFYENGADFLHENIGILREHPFETTFFEENALGIYRCDSTNFAVKVEVNGDLLLCVHVAATLRCFSVVRYAPRSLQKQRWKTA